MVFVPFPPFNSAWVLFQCLYKLHINRLVILSLLTSAEFPQYLYVVFVMPDTLKLDFSEIAGGEKEYKPGTTFTSQECTHRVPTFRVEPTMCFLASWCEVASLSDGAHTVCSWDPTVPAMPFCDSCAWRNDWLHLLSAHLDWLPRETSCEAAYPSAYSCVQMVKRQAEKWLHVHK